MRKSKRLIAEVAESYVVDLLRRYPGASPEIIFESIGGADVWVRIELPPELRESLLEILETTSELSYRFWDETGVNVLVTPVDQEPVSPDLKGGTEHGQR